ncbi:MAG: hypothetical protein NW201_12790 [Gemmatimonadales bacterium]|nr:hypothetical protein [Gemmatimonadales bacterium]
MWSRVAGGVAALILVTFAPSARLAAQGASGAPPAAAGADALAQALPFESLERYLLSILPPEAQPNVKGLRFGADNGELEVEAEVNLAAVQGLDMLSRLGWQRLRAVGPVRVLRPGSAGWEVRSASLGMFPVAQAIWAPLLQKVTKRQDTVIPVIVAPWVKRVEVDSAQLLLY